MLTNDATAIKVTEILHRLGARTKNKGFEAVRIAILTTIADPNSVQSVMQLYQYIAYRLNTKPALVERNIRYVVESSWTRAELDLVHEIFGYSVDANKGRPTVSEFIAGVADYIRLRPEL